jgi:hypothetical protein
VKSQADFRQVKGAQLLAKADPDAAIEVMAQSLKGGNGGGSRLLRVTGMSSFPDCPEWEDWEADR